MLVSLLPYTEAMADDIRIAVASNFRSTMQTLVELYQTNSQHKVLISAGSTGKHYAQIKNGAPYDLFFAADVERPTLLESEGFSIAGSRYTYALGKLVLWNPIGEAVTENTLAESDFSYLALANPLFAPYGRAAEQVLDELNLSAAYKTKLVKGENIAQAFQFVATGNAQLGFVAYSQILGLDASQRGSFWLVPQHYYSKIEQQLILLKETPANRDFFMFIKSTTAREIISNAGYDLPMKIGSAEQVQSR